MHDPIILDSRQLLLDHHGRLAAVEIEAREARVDVAELNAAIAGATSQIGEVRQAVADVAAEVRPLVQAAAAAHQQASTLLTYLFSACLAIAGGALSAWLTQLARLASGAQVGVSAGAALACVLMARVVIAHSQH